MMKDDASLWIQHDAWFGCVCFYMPYCVAYRVSEEEVDKNLHLAQIIQPRVFSCDGFLDVNT